MKLTKWNKHAAFAAVSMTMVALMGVSASAIEPSALMQVGNAVAIPAAWTALMEEYRVIVAGITGIGVMTSVLVFIIHAIQLATMPSHPIKRRACIVGMVISGITTMLLGSITLIMTLFYATIFL